MKWVPLPSKWSTKSERLDLGGEPLCILLGTGHIVNSAGGEKINRFEEYFLL